MTAPMEPTFPDQKVPARIGRYVDLHVLGRGGMGVVYRGYDPELDRAVAIKLMLHSTADFVARFRREAQSIARLTHGNVVQVYDFGVDEETNPYFVMELVAGTPLDALLRERGALPVAQTIEIARQAALGLSAAHHAGIIHRDVKPSNLIVDERGNVKLVDFGIARASSGAQLTQAASLMGTPGYMAPEQARGLQVDARADVYALGLTMFEMLAGEAPFNADDPIALVVMNMQDPLPDLRKRGTFPPQLVTLVEQMAMKDREQRPQTCDAVARALEAIAAGANFPSDSYAVAPHVPSGATADGAASSVPPTNVYEAAGSTTAPRKTGLALGIATALATAGVGIALVYGMAGKHTQQPVVVAQLQNDNAKKDLTPEPKKVEPGAAPKTTEWAQKPIDRSGPLKVAVLKFKNLSGDEKLESMRDGIGESAIDQMAGKLPGRLQLNERSDIDADIAEIDRGKDEHFDKATMAVLGKLEGIDVAVQGSYQRSGNVLQVNARFIRVQTGEVLDTVRYQGKVKDILSTQDAVAQELTTHVVRLVDTERPLKGPVQGSNTK